MAIRGLKELMAAFQQLPAIAREALVNDAVAPTASAVAASAKARLQSSPSVRTRALLNHVAFSVSQKTGRARVGISPGTTTIAAPMGRIGRSTIRLKGIVVTKKGGGSRLDNPAKRGHFIEFGTRHMPAEPFMIPAAESQKGPFLSRCQAAGRRIEIAMKYGVAPSGPASSGGRLL